MDTSYDINKDLCNAIEESEYERFDIHYNDWIIEK